MNADIVVNSLIKRYNGVSALAGLTFEVERGSMYGFIGPDGAGKSTFMRIASCLLTPDNGSLVIRGHDIRHSHGAIRRIIGYMPQHFSQYPDLTVAENLAFFADLFGVGKKERRDRMDRLLSFSRLGPFKNRRAGALSGGMKRKLALSCTLIHTPEVLLLDEPTTGVDPVSRREFWDILAEVKKGGTTILVSTPYMDEAEKCDRVGFIMDGALIREGTPTELPKGFAGQIVSAEGADIIRLTRGREFPEPVRSVMTFGDRLHLVVDDAGSAIPVIRRFLADNGIASPVLARVEPSMEDLFVESMTHAH